MTTKKETTDKVAKAETNALAPMEKNMADSILLRISNLEKEGGLNFPKNYSPANALKAAWLMLKNAQTTTKKPVLESCTKESIANSLLDMVIQGLTPAKKQCYFIPYGNQLQLSRSYMGTVAVTKRLTGVEDVYANVIYAEDDFDYKINLVTGLKEIIKHDQSFQNIDNSKIVGAYAVILREDKAPYVEVMNMDQIKKAWNQGAANGNSPAHKNFPDEMAKKSVINRACKLFFNTSDDSDLVIGAINRTTDAEYADYNEVDAQKEIEENANKENIDIEIPTNGDSGDLSDEEKKKIEEKELAEAGKLGPGF
jgi:recombination protein RecT